MNKEMRKDFALLIRNWRLERNLGLRQFAGIIEIPLKTLSDIENPNHEQDFKNLKKRIKENEKLS